MAEENTQYKGILIRLLHKPPAETNYQPNFDFYSFGYFDGIKIIDKIQHLSDYFLDQDGVEDPFESSIYGFEEQHLCFYTPEPSVNIEKIINKNDGFPLFLITELKFKEKTRISFKQLKNQLKNIFEPFENVELFHSLGFYDYALIFRLEDINRLQKIIIDLKNKIVDAKGKLVIRSTYTITGFRELEDYSLLDQKITASIQLSLKNADSYAEVASEITEKLKGGVSNISHMIGKYDEELRIFTPLSSLINLFYSTNSVALLNPNSDLYRTHINYTNTKLLFPANELKKFRPNPSRNQTDKTREREIKLIYTFRFLIKSSKIPVSLQISLERLLHSLSIAGKSMITEGVVQNDFLDIMEALFKLIRYEIGCGNLKEEDYTNINFDFANLSPIEKDKFESSKPDLESLEMSIRFISDLFRSQIQANGRMFESPNFSSKFVGSLKSIFLIYNSIVESFQDVINQNGQNATNNNLEAKYTVNFFTTIDSTSKIFSFVLFPQAAQESNYKLIPIKLDIESFLNFSYAIPYLLHEIGHHYFAESVLGRFSETIIHLAINAFFADSDLYKGVMETIYADPSLNLMIKQSIQISKSHISSFITESLHLHSVDKNKLKTQPLLLPGIISEAFGNFVKSNDSKKYFEDLYNNCCNEAFEFTQKTHINDTKSIYLLLNYLRNYGINEKSKNNFDSFTDHLKKHLENIDCSGYLGPLEFVEELYADCFMKIMLDLTENQYEKLCLDNLRKQGNVDNILPPQLIARKNFIFNHIERNDLNQYPFLMQMLSKDVVFKEELKTLRNLKNKKCKHLSHIFQKYIDMEENINRDFFFLEEFQNIFLFSEPGEK